MDWSVIVNFLLPLKPWVETVFTVLGLAVTVGTAIDAMIPDEKDGGFMTKILNIKFLGDFLSYITRYSPLNHRDSK